MPIMQGTDHLTALAHHLGGHLACGRWLCKCISDYGTLLTYAVAHYSNVYEPVARALADRGTVAEASKLPADKILDHLHELAPAFIPGHFTSVGAMVASAKELMELLAFDSGRIKGMRRFEPK
jgi:hypothetical protein